MAKTHVQRTARTLAAAALAAAGALAVAGVTAAPASAQPITQHPGHSRAVPPLRDTVIASGRKLRHHFRPDGTGPLRAEPLTGPDDITRLHGDLFVAFANGVGPQGQAAPDGNLDSTIVEFTRSGQPVAQWDLHGKCDGLTADPQGGFLIATINEDAHSSLYTITPRTRAAEHYRYNEPLPHQGGTDAITIYRGRILISASAPGTTGAAAPNPAYPAVYVVTLCPHTAVARVSPLFFDEAPAFQANGAQAGKSVDLALTDPDSSAVVPAAARRYAGDFVLDSQGDQELIFDHFAGWHQQLTALHLPASVDDSAWATGPFGALYVTDGSSDTVNAVSGAFTAGTMYASVTPCGANSAPATCPAPGYPANYLATVSLRTGALTPVKLAGPALRTDGMIFVP